MRCRVSPISRALNHRLRISIECFFFLFGFTFTAIYYPAFGDVIKPCLSRTPQARRITAPAPNPPYPKTGFHFAAINKHDIDLASSTENIIQDLSLPGKSREAFDKLTKLGHNAMPAIRRMLASGRNLRLIRAALDLSETIGESTHEASKDIFAILRNRRLGALRIRAAKIIGGWGQCALPAIPVLFDCLKDPNKKFRTAIAESLLQIAEKSDAFLPEIKKMLFTKDSSVRNLLLEGLSKYGSTLHPVMPIVVAWLQGKQLKPVDLAENILPRLVPGVAALLPAFHVIISDPESETALADTPAVTDDEETDPDAPAVENETELANEAASFEDIPVSE